LILKIAAQPRRGDLFWYQQQMALTNRSAIQSPPVEPVKTDRLGEVLRVIRVLWITMNLDQRLPPNNAAKVFAAECVDLHL
jgi:hypothetical protein